MCLLIVEVRPSQWCFVLGFDGQLALYMSLGIQRRSGEWGKPMKAGYRL